MIRPGISVVSLLVFFCTVLTAQAQNGERILVQDGRVFTLRFDGKMVGQAFWYPTNYDWVVAPWKDDDANYKKIDERVRSSKLTSANLLKQMDAVHSKLTVKSSPQERFEYACLVNEAKNRNLLQNRTYPSETAIAVAFLSLPPQASSPTYHKIRFFMEMSVFPNSRLLPVAARLLQRDPADYEVQLRYGRALSLSLEIRDRERAVAFFEKLNSNQPGKIKTLTYLGGALWRLSDLNKDKDTLRRAASCYEQYLKQAPANEPFRPQAERVLGIIKKTLQR